MSPGSNEIQLLAESDEAGVYIAGSKDGRHIFVTGHSEYDPFTLKGEYDRDVNKALPIHVPKNFYPNDDPSKTPNVRWRGHANLLYSNWLNYYVYQATAFDPNDIPQKYHSCGACFHHSIWSFGKPARRASLAPACKHLSYYSHHLPEGTGALFLRGYLSTDSSYGPGPGGGPDQEGRLRRVALSHTYGETSTPQDFFHSIKETSPGLLIIDDRCLCVPDTTPDDASRADVQLYSTGYAKLVELNMGGYAFLDDNIAYHPVHLNFNPSDHDRIEASYKYAIMPCMGSPENFPTQTPTV